MTLTLIDDDDDDVDDDDDDDDTKGSDPWKPTHHLGTLKKAQHLPGLNAEASEETRRKFCIAPFSS